MSRAKKGSTLIKKVKSTPYSIVNVLPVNIHNIIGVKVNGDLKDLKSTDIPIMDLVSTGSTISKHNVEDTYLFKEIEEIKLDENKNDSPKEELPKVVQEESKELTIDDFIDDFKL